MQNREDLNPPVWHTNDYTSPSFHDFGNEAGNISDLRRDYGSKETGSYKAPRLILWEERRGSKCKRLPIRIRPHIPWLKVGLNQAFRQGGGWQICNGSRPQLPSRQGPLGLHQCWALTPLWYHASERTWSWLEEAADSEAKAMSGLPVGLIPGTDYLQTVVALAPADILVLYTDRITEAEDADGQDLGGERFLEWARLVPVDSPEATGEAVLEGLEAFQASVHHDDETLLVLQREKESLPVMLGEFGR